MVQMVVRLPGDWPADRLDEISKAETARGHELIKAGKLRRLFRIVGRRANFSIWDADSLEELHENLQSLPMHPWMDITVTYVDRAPIGNRIQGYVWRHSTARLTDWPGVVGFTWETSQPPEQGLLGQPQ